MGAELIPCETDEEFEQALRRLAVQRHLHLVFVPEAQAEAMPEAVEAFRKRSKAALLALPLVQSEEHPTLQQVRHLIEQATGASLI